MSNTTEIKAEALKKLSGKNRQITFMNYLFITNFLIAFGLGLWIFKLVQADYIYSNAYVQISNTQGDFKDWSKDLLLSIYSETMNGAIHSDIGLSVLISKVDLRLSGFNSEVSGALFNIEDQNGLLAPQITSLSNLKTDIVALTNNIEKQVTQAKINELNNKLATYQNALVQIKQYLTNTKKDNSSYIWSLVFLAFSFTVLGLIILSTLSQEYKIYGTLSQDNADLISNINFVYSEITKLFTIKDNHAIFYFNKKITAKQQFSTFKIAKIINKMIEMLDGFFQNLYKLLNNLLESHEEQGKLYKLSMPLVERQQHRSYEGLEVSKKITDFWNSWETKSKKLSLMNKAVKDRIHESYSNTELVNGRMNILRDSVQDTSKKIKRLGESAQSITQTTDLIGNVTKQIQVIALNTAIQASQSGDNGKQFGVIAKEIERLAKNSDDAAQKIETLIGAIQDDAKNAVDAMENSTKEVVQSTKMIDAALKNIDEAKKDISSLEQLENNLQEIIINSSEMHAQYNKSIIDGNEEIEKIKTNMSIMNEMYEKQKNMLEESIHFLRLSRNID